MTRPSTRCVSPAPPSRSRGVPVAWVPAFSVPDPHREIRHRPSHPGIGNSTKIGYFIRAPVYVSLGQTQDLTIAPMVSTSGGEVLGGEYRARWNNGGLVVPGLRRLQSQWRPVGQSGAADLWPSVRLRPAGTGRQLAHRLRPPGHRNNGYMRFYDISFLDRLVNDLFVEATPGRSRFALTQLLFPGLRSTRRHRAHPLYPAQAGIFLIPTQKVVGGSLRVDLNGVAHRPRQPAQRPAPDRRDQLEEALCGRQRPALDAGIGRAWRRLSFRRSGRCPQHHRQHPGARHRLCRAGLALALCRQWRQRPLLCPATHRPVDRPALWRQSHRPAHRGFQRFRVRRQRTCSASTRCPATT